MTKILDRLPPLPQSTDDPFEGRHVRVRRGQLLVWTTIGLRGERRIERLSPAFPVLFDTGNNYDFYLHEHRLVNWAGIRPSLLMVLGRRTVNEQVAIPCRAADVWLYPNEAGTYQRAADKPPFSPDFGATTGTL
ncbi:MAG TPA: hypothetical protein VFA18_20140 [Gemmataceae bacterium]|nr:hypothetical protein [Gemmataceae bacterium]